MKKLAIFVVSAMLSLPAFAQGVDPNQSTTTNNTSTRHTDDDQPREHVTVGAFLNYTRIQHASLNQYGLGGRLGFEMNRWAALEIEGAYNWKQNYSASIASGLGGGGVPTTETGKLRTVTFLVGPTIHTRGPVRFFGTIKGGFLNFNTTNTSTGTSSAIFHGDTNGVVYPGGGIELGGRHIALRGEIGDLIYFDRGANHNFRLTVGPVFRF